MTAFLAGLQLSPLAITMIAVFGFLPIYAADPSVRANVSANETTLGSPITFALEIAGVSNIGGAPNLNFPDFQVERAGQTQSYQWMNGQTSSLITFNYLLTPLKAGTLQIPSVTLNHNGQTYTTEPIAVVVRDAAAGGAVPATPGPPSAHSQSVQVPSEGLKSIFMTATVDVERVYVGQQILLKVQFLRRPDVRLASQPRYSEPNMTGFLVEPLKQQEFTTVINGVQYAVTEIPYALFPTSDGEFAVGSANIDVAVQRDVDPFDPNSFFQSFFGRGQMLRLNTRSIPIRVRALPKNKPDNFSGAVGRYKIRAKTETDNLEVGKPFNLIVTIEGVGNIKTLKEPALPELKEFRRYETISTSKIENDGRFLSGSKEFKILLIPQVSGPVSLPSLSYCYFNPSENVYVTDQTQELSFLVKPGSFSQENQESLPAASAPGQTVESIKVLDKDIRFIKTGQLRPRVPPLITRIPFYLFAGFPPLFALTALLAKVRAKKRSQFAGEYRSREAHRNAKKLFKKAKTLMAQPDPVPFYGALHRALTQFLADKWGASAESLIWDEMERRLKENEIDPDLIKQVRQLFDDADMARFATSSFTDAVRENSFALAQNILTRLEKDL